MACFPKILAEPQTFDCLSDAHFWPKAAVAADTRRLETIFKDIHQNPELGFMEVRTAGIIAEELTNLGFDVQTGIGETGVVGVFRNGQGPTVMYRADMDANAVEEASGLSYASKVRVAREDGSESPVAHMCGHDAHVTWMLGMANAIVGMKDDWSGTVVVVGQPAEEPITGAQAMVDGSGPGRFGGQFRRFQDGWNRSDRHSVPWYWRTRLYAATHQRSGHHGCLRGHAIPGDCQSCSGTTANSSAHGRFDPGRALVNDDRLASRMAVPLRTLLGEENVVTEFPPATGSGDVHMLLGSLTDVPFNFLIVGVADPDVFAAALAEGKTMPYSAHNPNFVVDLAAIPVGTRIATTAMLELLKG